MEGSRKKEKWNRLVDAFSLKGTSYVVPQYPQVEPEQMAEELSEISETVWGMYAFAREPLEGRFTREQKCHYIAKENGQIKLPKSMGQTIRNFWQNVWE